MLGLLFFPSLFEFEFSGLSTATTSIEELRDFFPGGLNSKVISPFSPISVSSFVLK